MSQSITLTIENAHLGSTITNKKNPEWGSKKFNHNSQSLTGNRFCSTFGFGSNSALLFESEYHFWEVITFKK